MLNQILSSIITAKSLKEIEALNIKYLGKNGYINKQLNQIKNVKSADEKKLVGQKINQQKNEIEKALKMRTAFLLNQTKAIIDLTLPGNTVRLGRLHPITNTISQITQIFAKIGFYRVSYPEIEYEYFSFDSLNIPATHPARDEYESFLVDGSPSSKYGRMVLSPHTSSGQVREMWRSQNKPIRMINIARCFRRNWDLTHTPMFHQFEGLCVDKDINISHLKGAINHFAKEYFGYDAKIRLRPYHFQFTEPSFEIDISCTLCHGTGFINKQKCRVCKSGWLELGGAGMVHPYVLKQGKIDSSKIQGWAFGFGVERVYMMKYQLNDLRKLFSGQLNIYNHNEY